MTLSVKDEDLDVFLGLLIVFFMAIGIISIVW